MRTTKGGDGLDTIGRREFIRRAGATGLALAGAIGGAAWFHDPRDGGAYFRDAEKKEGLTLPSFAVERPSGAVELAIARGEEPEKLVQAAVGALHFPIEEQGGARWWWGAASAGTTPRGSR